MNTQNLIEDIKENQEFSIIITSSDKKVKCKVIQNWNNELVIEWNDCSEDTPIYLFKSLLEDESIKVA